MSDLWTYRPAWLRLFLWELARGADGLFSIRGEMNGKHYNIRPR